MDVLPYQTEGLPESVGLTVEQCQEAAWFVDEAGRQYRGAAAINRALRTMSGVYRVVSWLYGVPGLDTLEDRLYEWVARNRHRMPGSTAACAASPSKSTRGSDGR
jgi:predicted DCC family thiol-disulfide oxidoreductase YuxK